MYIHGQQQYSSASAIGPNSPRNRAQIVHDEEEEKASHHQPQEAWAAPSLIAANASYPGQIPGGPQVLSSASSSGLVAGQIHRVPGDGNPNAVRPIRLSPEVVSQAIVAQHPDAAPEPRAQQVLEQEGWWKRFKVKVAERLLGGWQYKMPPSGSPVSSSHNAREWMLHYMSMRSKGFGPSVDPGKLIHCLMHMDENVSFEPIKLDNFEDRVTLRRWYKNLSSDRIVNLRASLIARANAMPPQLVQKLTKAEKILDRFAEHIEKASKAAGYLSEKEQIQRPKKKPISESKIRSTNRKALDNLFHSHNDFGIICADNTQELAQIAFLLGNNGERKEAAPDVSWVLDHAIKLSDQQVDELCQKSSDKKGISLSPVDLAIHFVPIADLKTFCNRLNSAQFVQTLAVLKYYSSLGQTHSHKVYKLLNEIRESAWTRYQREVTPWKDRLIKEPIPEVSKASQLDSDAKRIVRKLILEQGEFIPGEDEPIEAFFQCQQVQRPLGAPSAKTTTPWLIHALTGWQHQTPLDRELLFSILLRSNNNGAANRNVAGHRGIIDLAEINRLNRTQLIQIYKKLQSDEMLNLRFALGPLGYGSTSIRELARRSSSLADAISQKSVNTADLLNELEMVVWKRLNDDFQVGIPKKAPARASLTNENRIALINFFKAISGHISLLQSRSLSCGAAKCPESFYETVKQFVETPIQAGDPLNRSDDNFDSISHQTVIDLPRSDYFSFTYPGKMPVKLVKPKAGAFAQRLLAFSAYDPQNPGHIPNDEEMDSEANQKKSFRLSRRMNQSTPAAMSVAFLTSAETPLSDGHLTVFPNISNDAIKSAAYEMSYNAEHKAQLLYKCTLNISACTDRDTGLRINLNPSDSELVIEFTMVFEDNGQEKLLPEMKITGTLSPIREEGLADADINAIIERNVN